MDAITILYVDDDDNDVFIVRRALGKIRANTSVHTVGDGLYAIDYLRGQGSYADRRKYPLPQLILSDLKMPRVSGIGLLRWLRKQPEFARIPFVLLSSSCYGNDVQSALELGANGYVVKTSSLAILERAMTDLVTVCRGCDFQADGWLNFTGNQAPSLVQPPDAHHPGGIFCQNSWIPTLRRPEE